MERMKEVKEALGAALDEIGAQEKQGKPFADARLRQMLESRELELDQDLSNDHLAQGLGILRLDNDELLAVYAKELAKVGDKSKALRNLMDKASGLSVGWLLKTEGSAKTAAQGPLVEAAVEERNSLFDPHGEPSLTKEQTATLNAQRLAYLEQKKLDFVRVDELSPSIKATASFKRRFGRH
jgi:hypothetical protein